MQNNEPTLSNHLCLRYICQPILSNDKPLQRFLADLWYKYDQDMHIHKTKRSRQTILVRFPCQFRKGEELHQF